MFTNLNVNSIEKIDKRYIIIILLFIGFQERRLNMSEISWIKISTGLFNDEKIKIIEQMPEGDAILVIWLKLLTMAGKSNMSGLVCLNEYIPYTDEMLSIIMRKQISLIKLALQTFIDFGMVEITTENKIYLSNWEKYQNTDRLEELANLNRQRVAKHREKHKDDFKLLPCNITCNVTCNDDVMLCNGQDKDKDEDKDKDNNIVPKKNKSSKSGNESNNNNATIKTKEELQAWDFKNDENFKEWFLKFPEETREALLKKYSKRGTCEKPSDYIAMKIEEIINYHPKKPYKDYKKVLQNWINMDIDRL